jgi:hypothetical protein
MDVPTVTPADHEALTTAATLPDAEYGTRIYSMTALYALAAQREAYEREIAALRAGVLSSRGRAGFFRDTRGALTATIALGAMLIAGSATLLLNRTSPHAVPETAQVATPPLPRQATVRIPLPASPEPVETAADTATDRATLADAALPQTATSSNFRRRPASRRLARVQRRAGHQVTRRSTSRQMASADIAYRPVGSQANTDTTPVEAMPDAAAAPAPVVTPARRHEAIDALRALRLR